ncbi:MAG: acyl-CoA thioesterase [Bacteroidetes bacterium]|nr:acyl-CoA thioesterase [Bacteroidota bacterium]
MTNFDFPVKLELRIDWSELDTFGHVNNISIFKYIQSSRVEYLERIGLTKMHQQFKIGPILASCKCEFKRPLFYPGKITIQSRVEFIKNTSFCICHQIIDDKNQLSAEAQDIIVLFDFNKNKKVQLSHEIRGLIEKLENKAF